MILNPPVKFPFYLGILLDSYFSATSEISNYIKENDYRISQTVEVNDRSYGILVRNRTLRDCLNNEFQMVLYDTYELTEIITGEIESEVLEAWIRLLHLELS
jgi:hypothetical protein